MKKLLAIILALALVFALVAGCGSGSSDTAPPAGSSDAATTDTTDSSSSGDTETVIVWTWFSEQLGPSVGAAFEEKFPQYKVDAVNIPSGELEQLLLTGISAQTGLPDTNALQGDSIQRFIQFGGLLDLTDRIEPMINDFPGYKIANNTSAQGRIYGLPIDSGPCALYYHLDLAEEAGIDPAVDFATYESWLASGAKYAANDIALHRMTETGVAQWALMLVQQQGQSIFTADGAAQVNTAEFLNAAQLAKDLFDSGYAGLWDEWTPQYADAVMNLEVGTIIAAAWYMNVFIHSFSDARDWAIVPMPTFPGSTSRTSNMGGSEMVIPASSDNPEGGWEFIRFYCADVEGRKIGMDALGEFPAFLPLYREQSVQDKTLPFFRDQKVFAFFATLLPEVPDWRSPPPLIPVRDMLDAEFHSFMIGDITLDAFGERAQNMAEGIVRDFD